MEDVLKTEIDQFIDNGFAEFIAFVYYITTDIFEEHDFLPAIGFHREDVAILLGNICQSTIEYVGEFGFILFGEKMRYELFSSQSCRAFAQLHQQLLFHQLFLEVL